MLQPAQWQVLLQVGQFKQMYQIPVSLLTFV